MKLNFINVPVEQADRYSLNQALNIHDERADFLCKEMDRLVKEAKTHKKYPYAMLLADIAELCKNPEELTFAMITHARWVFYSVPSYNPRNIGNPNFKK